MGTVEALEAGIDLLEHQVGLQTQALRQILEMHLKGANGAAGTVVALEGGPPATVDVRLGETNGTGWQPTDARGQLPLVDQVKYPGLSYGTRPLAAITGVTVHYTAGPSNGTAQSTAQWQVSDAAISHTGNGTPFPGLAYTLFVEEAGNVVLAHDLTTRVWHSAAVVNGKGRNYTNVGICYGGDTEPNVAQRVGIRHAIKWVEDQLGRSLAIEGHRDAPYNTDCPGPAWPGWKPDIMP